MMKKYLGLCLLVFLFCFADCCAQKTGLFSFKVIPLGVKGGSDESNLSAYMIASAQSNQYVCLDAGTLHSGIEKAVKAGIFKTTTSSVLRNNIKGYLISHPHLDHVAGLIINSPDDTSKNIYGSSFCLDIIKDKYFSWKSWANFANEGDKPALGKYHYSYLTPGNETPLDQTDLAVTSFTLSHSNPYQSTAFLIRSDSGYVLYLGDTGADEVEKSDNLHQLWSAVAPLITTKKLKAIFIEVSFPNQQPVKQLFGHLTPQLLMNEMKVLADLSNKEAMKNCKVVITHIKPIGNNEADIKKQLYQLNALHLNLVFPQQAQQINL